MFKSREKTNNKKIDTLIGKETKILGKLEAKGIIRVDGFFEGDIITESDVIVGENAVVKGQVKGNNVTLAGRVEGNIESVRKLEIRSSGALIGDMVAGTISIEEGGFFTGNCKMIAAGNNVQLASRGDKLGKEEKEQKDKEEGTVKSKERGAGDKGKEEKEKAVKNALTERPEGEGKEKEKDRKKQGI